MATKQQKAVQRAVTKEKKRGKEREERHILWLLLLLIALLLYLLFAQHYDWWPFAQPKLGTAFYTNVVATAPKPAVVTSSSKGTSSSGSSSSTRSGKTTTNGSGSNGSSSGNSGGSGGSTPTSPTSSSSTPSIANFAAGINVGDTKAQTSGQANGLGQACAIVVNASTSSSLGQQQVCTYTQGNKIVTITYLNDHVISASKSGF